MSSVCVCVCVSVCTHASGRQCFTVIVLVLSPQQSFVQPQTARFVLVSSLLYPCPHSWLVVQEARGWHGNQWHLFMVIFEDGDLCLIPLLSLFCWCVGVRLLWKFSVCCLWFLSLLKRQRILVSFDRCVSSKVTVVSFTFQSSPFLLSPTCVRGWNMIPSCNAMLSVRMSSSSSVLMYVRHFVACGWNHAIFWCS